MGHSKGHKEGAIYLQKFGETIQNKDAKSKEQAMRRRGSHSRQEDSMWKGLLVGNLENSIYVEIQVHVNSFLQVDTRETTTMYQIKASLGTASDYLTLTTPGILIPWEVK